MSHSVPICGKSFWIDTCVFYKFKIFNSKNDIRNLKNTVQNRSASAKALHIENKETDSNCFGHLHSMLLSMGWALIYS